MRVHGGGELLDRMSARFGRRGQYADWRLKDSPAGMATVRGLEFGTYDDRSGDFEFSLSERDALEVEKPLVSLGEADRLDEALSDRRDIDFRRMRIMLQDFHERERRIKR